MRTQLRFAGSVVVAALALLAASCSSEPPTPAGIVRDPAPVVGDVSLPDVSSGGADFAFKADPGEVLVVYFGFTSCPDVCPTTLADVRKALRELGDDARYVDVAMITVDPERDDDERLTAYIQTFAPDARALRTLDDDELFAAAEAFGASYAVETNENGDVEVGHTAFLYAVDDAGLLRLQWSFGTPAEDLRADLEILLDAWKENRT